MSKFLPARSMRVAILLAVLIAAVCADAPAHVLHATPAAPQASHAVYLPMIARGGSPTTPPPTPPPTEASGALFMQPQKKIAGPSIKVDAQGGMHLAYYGAVPLADKPAATYAYCPPPAAQCGDSRKWSFLSMGDQIDEVQLQLTPQGHPRLLLGYHDTAKFLRVYIYGECDSNCTAGESSWAFVAVTVRSLNAASYGDIYLPNRTFALDPQGRPAFAIYDNNYVNVEPDHIGGYYFACQANCTQPGSWTETLFTHRNGYNNELVSQPVLQFTSDGKPRILAMLYPLNGTGDNGIYYFSCDGACDNSASWQRTLVADRGSGPYPTWDLALDGQNRPRVSFFKYDASDGTGQTLFYLWCDASCTSSGGWRMLNLGLPKGDGIGANIELDPNGRPRIAYLDSENLGYAWCDTNCTNAAGWRHGYADDDQTMEQEYPIARPVTCSAGIWDSYSPSFALDRQGNPRIAYDASYKAYCQYQDPTDPTKPPSNEFIEIWHSVRTVFVPHP
jgi:hypothetical protein